MHILLLEPDVLQASCYREALERAGHKVSHALSAQGAVQLADAQVPDAVVLELQLQGHNGVEFLYEFRSYHEWLHVPAIIHSFVSPQELARSAILATELGVVAVLHKPRTSLKQLCAAVRSVGNDLAADVPIDPVLV
jgi:DNA-binding response OmpR family regulator